MKRVWSESRNRHSDVFGLNCFDRNLRNKIDSAFLRRLSNIGRNTLQQKKLPRIKTFLVRQLPHSINRNHSFDHLLESGGLVVDQVTSWQEVVGSIPAATVSVTPFCSVSVLWPAIPLLTVHFQWICCSVYYYTLLHWYLGLANVLASANDVLGDSKFLMFYENDCRVGMSGSR